MDLLNTCAQMDIFDLCDCLEDDSIDMILADLPYQTTELEWDTIIPLDDMWECFKRVIKPRGAVVLTASQPFTSQLIMSNLDMFKYEWVWAKSSSTRMFNVKYAPLVEHEQIIIFSEASATPNQFTNIKMQYYPQGLRPLHKVVNGHRKTPAASSTLRGLKIYKQEYTNWPRSIINISKERNNNHPTQKPVALFEYLIRTYTQPGETVFDPCVGSGTTAIAARNTGRNYIVGDSSAEYVQVARDRLAKPYTLPLFNETPTEQAKPEQMTMEI